MSDTRAVKERYEKELLAIKGVTGVGYNHSINVYVEKLTPQTSQFIPRVLEGVNVRIIETGRIKLLAFPVVSSIYTTRTNRIRPVVGGISISHLLSTAGTLACTVKDKISGKIFGLSNNHVVAMQWGEKKEGKIGDSIVQPGVVDGGTETDKIGELVKWKEVSLESPNIIDAGIFTVDGLNSILEVGKPAHVVEPTAGITVKKSGRSSGLTFGRIIDLGATMTVEGWGNAVFEDQIVVSPAFGIPGDSGSWVGDENDNTIGLLFAGSTEITLVNKAKNIEELLGVEFSTYLTSVPIEYVYPIPAVLIGAIIARVVGVKEYEVRR